MEEPVRLNIRVSARANRWLEEKSTEMAIPKSSLISFAVENYIKETEVSQGLPQVVAELKKHGISLEE